MRLLQIIPLLDSYRVFLRELAQSLLEDGHEVLTLCHTGEGNAVPEHESAVECRSFNLPRGANPVHYLRSASELSKIVREYQPDVIHAHFSAGLLTAAITRRKLGSLNKAVWQGTFQGVQFPFLHGFRGWLTGRAEAFAAAQMDKVWVLTADDAAALHKAAPEARVVIQKTPGFGCADRFVATPIPSEEDRHKKRLEAGFTPENILFLFIGRLVAFKGFHLAFRAFREAHKQNSQFKFLVIGERDGLHSTGLSEEEWQQFIDHPAIQYLGTQSDVLPWLDISDALLFPSSREGMSVSCMEALARRLPVLTNPVRGCKELITENQNGTFFKAPTVEAIRHTLTSFVPYRHQQPVNHLKRSHWVQEMKAEYAQAAIA